MGQAFPQGLDLHNVSNMLSQHLLQQDAMNRSKEALDKLNAASTRTEYNPDNPDESQNGWSFGKGTPASVPVSPTDPSYVKALGEYGLENPQGAQFQLGLQKERMPQVIHTAPGATTSLYDPQTQTTKEIAKGGDLGTWKPTADGSMAYFPRSGASPTVSDVKGPEKSLSIFADWRKSHPFDPIDNFYKMQASAKNAGVISMPPEAVDLGASQYLSTGQLPSLGMGQAGMVVRAQMLTRAAQMNKENGGAGNQQVLNSASFTANKQALNYVTKQQAAVNVSGKAALDNLALAEQQSAKLDRTQVPAVNRMQQWAQKNLTGDPNLTSFENYIYTASREYAKVTQGSAASSQQLTVSASGKADELLNAAQSPAQFKAAMEAMKNDMANVVGELENQRQQSQQNLKDIVPSNPFAPKSATPSKYTIKKYQ